VEEANQRAAKLVLELAAERAAREAQDKRIAEIVAWMQSSTGSPVPLGLMGPPTHPNQSPLMQTLVSHTCKELQH
jgi:septal ring factor EnvC (AmiA/AmiB activator)